MNFKDVLSLAPSELEERRKQAVKFRKKVRRYCGDCWGEPKQGF